MREARCHHQHPWLVSSASSGSIAGLLVAVLGLPLAMIPESRGLRVIAQADPNNLMVRKRQLTASSLILISDCWMRMRHKCCLKVIYHFSTCIVFPQDSSLSAE